MFLYLVLLRVGFTLPPRVATGAVRSYRTISTLPPAQAGLAVYFLLHFPFGFHGICSLNRLYR
jgi:hypothetical protein